MIPGYRGTGLPERDLATGEYPEADTRNPRYVGQWWQRDRLAAWDDNRRAAGG